MSNYHTTVLLREAVDFLQIQHGQWYIDGTLGGGGHTIAVLERGGKVLGLDVDQEAITYVNQKVESGSLNFAITKGDLRLVRGNFRDIDTLAREQGIETVAGILFDLGVSGHQLDTAARGFSLQHEAVLDMRMGTDLSVTANDLVNGLTERELNELFEKLGEERFAKKIAAAITKERARHQITSTSQLAAIVKAAVPFGKPGIHPATRIFQALRIAVNDELHSIREVLPKAVRLVASGGRIVVITFHSLEDRIVKQSFQEFEKNGWGTVVTKKPVTPSEEEVLRNPRSRSAKLRVFEKK